MGHSAQTHPHPHPHPRPEQAQTEDTEAVRRGIDYLMSMQEDSGDWAQEDRHQDRKAAAPADPEKDPFNKNFEYVDEDNDLDNSSSVYADTRQGGSSIIWIF